ncbi:MAG: hypothetical protein LBD64_02165 [Odoribacteraceae bacterium]|jgi:hypothetical protein|nr:hypothetical protein [Odoribacteraceae bacterium]
MHEDLCRDNARIVLFSSCLQRGEVQLSGRVEGNDSAIVFRSNDRDFRSRVTDNTFSIKIPLQESAYVHAHLLPSYKGMLLFLTLGEQLEIIVKGIVSREDKRISNR